MNQEVKQKWLDALRSGEYRQAHGQLKWNNQFCCLGVLCDLHAQETGNEWGIGSANKPSYMNQAHILPLPVIAWAGLDCDNPEVDDPERSSLAELNDNEVPFTEIADIIEAQL